MSRQEEWDEVASATQCLEQSSVLGHKFFDMCGVCAAVIFDQRIKFWCCRVRRKGPVDCDDVGVFRLGNDHAHLFIEDNQTVGDCPARAA